MSLPDTTGGEDRLRLAPTRIEAVLFDMDGVLTQTATVHAAAWKRLFDEYLQGRARERHEEYLPFDVERDYREFVDGRPRHEGVRRFLESRGITLPFGDEDDDPGARTVCGLGTRKNRYFREWLDQHVVSAFPGAQRLVELLHVAGVKTGVFSASRNAKTVLQSAGLLNLFDVAFTGAEAADLGLPGKPDPAMLSETATRLGVSPECTAIFEDATAGIEAAVLGRFGLAIGVDRTNNADALRRAGAHLVVRHLSEVTWRPVGGLLVKTLSNRPLVRDREAEFRKVLTGKTLALFLDYDGTLTPIVEDHTKAFLSDDMRGALAKLSEYCTVAIVSGRDVAVVRELVGVDSIFYAGSHGFEIRGPQGWSHRLEKGIEFLPEIDDAERRLRQRLAGISGHAVERKRFSVAVHYRRVPDADVARIESAVDRVLSGHRGLHKGRGKKVFRIQPNIDWGKGHAVLWLLDRLNLGDRPDVFPIYVGDDITDEDAFRALAGRGLSVVVLDADERSTAADFAATNPDEVKRFLEFLAAVASGADMREAET